MEIAAETGFSDQAHFTRVFRKNVGTTPATWKKARVA
jgi:AraC-like DNA-binding protein